MYPPLDEFKTPRCFIILPYRLEKDDEGGVRQVEEEAAMEWFGSVTSVASTAAEGRRLRGEHGGEKHRREL